jgi:hypothetical protein
MRRKIKINLDKNTWDFGDWPDRIRKAITVNINRSSATSISFDVDINYDELENAARDICKESIEAFFNAQWVHVVTISKDGIVIDEDGMEGGLSEKIVVPWINVNINPRSNPTERIQEWLKEQNEWWE